jgi:ATP-dependent helicase HrpB
LANGRTPILIELLAPNFRPVQLTRDLASFWRTAYFEVKRDLRIRYPKHSWPEDPLTAKPEAKGRRRMPLSYFKSTGIVTGSTELTA